MNDRNNPTCVGPDPVRLACHYHTGEEGEEMKRPESPCRDCEERRENCHSECEKYIEYTEERKQYNEFVKQNRIKEYVGSITDRTRFKRRIDRGKR